MGSYPRRNRYFAMTDLDSTLNAHQRAVVREEVTDRAVVSGYCSDNTTARAQTPNADVAVDIRRPLRPQLPTRGEGDKEVDPGGP